MIAETALTLAGLSFEVIDLEWSDLGPGTRVLAELNPLGQVPTLVLPDGRVMTESAAIILYLAEHYPHSELAPPSNVPERALFLRWLLFLVAALYPTFTYGDEAARWVDVKSAPALRESTDRHRQVLYRELESQAAAPWFLGPRFSALDIYIATMTRWRPGRDWFVAHCPRLSAISTELESIPVFRDVCARNFDPR